jgi:glycosyltransferase involved in cell wall biosynthesis
MVTVSVVLPTYNRAANTERAIRSVLRQSLTDLELIVVDDASTDDTEGVVNAFDDPRIDYVRHEVNRGGSAARNTGIERSSGEYIAFLDDDDVWHPEKLERQVEEMESRSEDWVASYCDYEYVRHENEVGNYVPDFLIDLWTGGDSDRRPEGGEELIPHVLALNLPYGGASTLLVRGSVVREIGGFDPDFKRHQDIEFVIRVLQQGRLAYVDGTLVTKHGTGRPSPADLVDAKSALFEKFQSEIREANRAGFNIKGIHQFELVKRYIVTHQYRAALRWLPGAEIKLRALVRAFVVAVFSSIAGGREYY